MNLLLLLDMAAAGRGDAAAVKVDDDQLTVGELAAAAWAGAELAGGASALAYVGTNGLAFPIGVFAAAGAGVPFVPLNYRLSHDQLHELLAPLGDTLVVADGERGDRAGASGPPGHRHRRRSWPRPGPARTSARCPTTASRRRCCSTRAAPPRRRRPPCCATGTSRPT